MTHDEIRDAINAEPEAIAAALGIERDRSGKGYVCPECGSGSGKNGTGPTLKNGRFKCWAECGWGGDAVDVIQRSRGCGYHDALQIGADMLGLPLPGNDEAPHAAKPKPAKPEPPEAKPLPDFSEELATKGRLPDYPEAVAYLEGRGLNVATADKLGLRFDPECHTPRGVQPCVIIPLYRQTGYVMRGITPDGFKGLGSDMKGQPFNAKALTGTAPVFITEGWADALSIIEVGGKALSLNGVDRGPLLNLLKRMKAAGRPIPPLVIALDNDKAGKDATDKMKADLTDANIQFITGNLYGDAKDANEALIADRPTFAYAVYRAGVQATLGVDEGEMKAAAGLANTRHMAGYAAYRKQAAETPRISTGVERLDAVLGGGLYPGLFALGGDTGAGKTSFVLQIADFIAESGKPVLYVALEMSRYELIAKSVSRITAEMDAADGTEGWRGVPYRDLLNGRTGGTIVRAEKRYAQMVAPNLHVMEGLEDVGAADIRRTATALKAATGTAPVIIVDYLQNMTAADPHDSERQAVDHNVKSLKLLSRDLNAPVIVLSSLNRESLKDGGKKVGLYSYKESGGIEYTADAALMICRTDGEERPCGKEAARYARPVALEIMKNRRGPVPPKWICLDFYAATSRFVEVAAVEAPWAQERGYMDDAEIVEDAAELWAS